MDECYGHDLKEQISVSHRSFSIVGVVGGRSLASILFEIEEDIDIYSIAAIGSLHREVDTIRWRG